MIRIALLVFLLVICGALTLPPVACAGVTTQLVREAAECALERAGVRVVTRQAVETLSRQIAVSAARHGDQIIIAVRRVGPKALQLVEEAATCNPRLGAQAARLLASEGEQAAVCVLTRPQAMAQFARYGEGAAQALIRHTSVAEPLIEAGGQPAIAALKAVTPQSGRRLAMLAAEGGDLAQLTRDPRVLSTIASRGDEVCSFIWRNKGALAVTGVAASFMVNPQPYLDGTVSLAGVVTQNAVKPIAQSTNWTLIFSIGALLLAALAALRLWLKARLRVPVLTVTK
jgi:hypothetical protein